MKKFILFFLIMLSGIMPVAQDNFYELFRLTENFYSETDDLEQAVLSEYGEKYKMADWNEMLPYEQVIFNWVQCLPLTDNLAVFVTKDGEHWWNGANRHFYFQFFADQEPPIGFLSHDEMGDELLCLGSWFDVSMPILCMLKEDDFRMSVNTYGENENLEQGIIEEMGENYRLADWNDIKDYENNIQCWATFNNLLDNSTFWVTYNGEHFWNESRHYFVQHFADQQPNPGFLAHEQMGDDLLCLGSWYNLNLHLLGINIESSGINRSGYEMFNVFPNPVKESITIQSEYRMGKIYIMDMQGNLVQSCNLKPNIDVQKLLPGVYVLQLITDQEKQLIYRKFIKI